jgi:hypothetical protein
MRTEEVKPIVFNLVDNDKVLKRHFGHRNLKTGGIIKKYKK